LVIALISEPMLFITFEMIGETRIFRARHLGNTC
jgi:hypothetical protein